MNSCTIASAILFPGKTTVFQQSPAGFCKEWILGPVTRTQRILVSFLNVDIKCGDPTVDDKLYIYNEDRSFLLYDYCVHKSPDASTTNFVMANAKYLVARMMTSSPRYISATFELVLLDPSSPGTIPPLEPAIFLPTPVSEFSNELVPQLKEGTFSTNNLLP